MSDQYRRGVGAWGVAGAVAAMSALIACRGAGSSGTSSSSAPVVPGAPLELTWEQPYKLVASGGAGEAMFFATKDADKPQLRLEASFHGFAQGTKVKFGGEENTLGANAYWSTLYDIKPAVLKQSLEDLKGPIDLELEVSLTPPGAAPTTLKLPKQNVKESLRFALLKARDGGVTFAADDTAAGKPRAAAVISGYSDLDFVGSAKSVKELDWVVVAEDQPEPRTSKSCRFKEGPSTLKVFDATAVAYDRRTGQKLAEQVVRASDECPMFAMVHKEDNSTKNTVSAKDVLAWARSALASGPAKSDQPTQRGHEEPSTQNRVTL